jgi:PAS domain S-box-containing protein
MDRLEKRLKRAGLWNPVGRYAFGAATVMVAYVLRDLLTPVIGHGAPFVLFFAATLVTGLAAGIGPAIGCIVLGLSMAVAYYMRGLGEPGVKALVQALLYAVDGSLVVYLTALTRRGRRRYEGAIAKWQRADEQCVQAFERTRETIELAPDAYFMADLDARITEVNQAATHLLGYSREQLVGMKADVLIQPGETPRLLALRSELLAPGAINKSEWTLRRADGTLVPVEISSNILPGGRWQAYARDISAARQLAHEREELLERERDARKAAESAMAQLRESEERVRLTIDEAPIGMALVDLDRKFVSVNRALCEVTGYESDEMLAMSIRQVVHPDDLPTEGALADRLIRGDIVHYQSVKRFIRKDRATIDVSISGGLLRAADGTPRYFIVQVEDITERKRAEAALRRSEAKFSGIINIAADAIISVDERQRIILFNTGAERIFGYTNAEIMGEPLDKLIPERFREVHARHFAGFASGAEVSRTMAERREVFGLRKNGEAFPAEASISKVALGETTIFSLVMHDITYRKSVEQALQLALTARDDVLGIVAHDLRNPLSTIVMQLSAMERQGSEPERRDTKPLEVISRSANRMTHLIQDLLDVTVVEAGQLKLDPEPLPAHTLTSEAVESQAPLAASAGVELTCEVAPDAQAVWGDHQRLLQVFENLIGNALKFTQAGGHVTVAAAPTEHAVEFTVADTGSGIARENLGKLFQPFWQASRRSSRLGAGLGLPITKGIVEAHGGRIWADSTLGHGTTFHFIIPAPR